MSILNIELMHKTIQGSLEFTQKKFNKMLQMAKVLDLFDFLANSQTQNEQAQQNLIIPCVETAKKNSRDISTILKDFLTDKDKMYSKAVYEYFSGNVSDEDVDFFVNCCFPSLFNQFASHEYSEFGYKFIMNYKELKPDCKLTSTMLASSFILHNFKFRYELCDLFLRNLILDRLNDNQLKVEPDHQFQILIKSFADCLSFLNEFELQLLGESTEDTFQLIKTILLRCLQLWCYTPQFSGIELLYVLDISNPDKYARKCDLLNYIEKLVYSKESQTLNSLFKRIKNSPFSNQIELHKILVNKTNIRILSYYEASLLFKIFEMIPKDYQVMTKQIPDLRANRDEEKISFFIIDIDDPLQGNRSVTTIESNIDRIFKMKFPKNQKNVLDEWEKIKQKAIDKNIDILKIGNQSTNKLVRKCLKAERECMNGIDDIIRERIGSMNLFENHYGCMIQILRSIFLKFSERKLLIHDQDNFNEIMNDTLINYFQRAIQTKLNKIFDRQQPNQAFEVVIKSFKDELEKIKKDNNSNKTLEEKKNFCIECFLQVLEKYGIRDFQMNPNLLEKINFFFEIFGLFEYSQYIIFLNNVKAIIKGKYRPVSNLIKQNNAFIDFSNKNKSYISFINQMLSCNGSFNRKRTVHLTGFSFISLGYISKLIIEIDIDRQFNSALMDTLLGTDDEIKQITYKNYIYMAQICRQNSTNKFELPKYLEAISEVSKYFE